MHQLILLYVIPSYLQEFLEYLLICWENYHLHNSATSAKSNFVAKEAACSVLS